MTTDTAGVQRPEPVLVRNCSRLGRQANAPAIRLPLAGWLRRRGA